MFPSSLVCVEVATPTYDVEMETEGGSCECKREGGEGVQVDHK